MDEDNHALFHQLIFMFEQLAEPKYEEGAIEHGGVLTDMTEEELDIHELNELIDLVMYRMTRILKKRDQDSTD